MARLGDLMPGLDIPADREGPPRSPALACRGFSLCQDLAQDDARFSLSKVSG
jgi:hypothetical protein